MLVANPGENLTSIFCFQDYLTFVRSQPFFLLTLMHFCDQSCLVIFFHVFKLNQFVASVLTDFSISWLKDATLHYTVNVLD